MPVIVRDLADFCGAAAKCPFADVAAERPQSVHLGFAKRPPAAGAVAALSPWCTAGERVVVRRGAVWIDFAGGVARSKLTPAVIDRCVGSTVTLRNLNTVQAIDALLRTCAGG